MWATLTTFFFCLPQVTWLSKWDGLLAGTKYMMLAASSSFKGKSDMAKYDKAMKLKGFIERIRADYTKKLSSGDKRTKQVRVCSFVVFYSWLLLPTPSFLLLFLSLDRHIFWTDPEPSWNSRYTFKTMCGDSSLPPVAEWTVYTPVCDGAVQALSDSAATLPTLAYSGLQTLLSDIAFNLHAPGRRMNT